MKQTLIMRQQLSINLR